MWTELDTLKVNQEHLVMFQNKLQIYNVEKKISNNEIKICSMY